MGPGAEVQQISRHIERSATPNAGSTRTPAPLQQLPRASRDPGPPMKSCWHLRSLFSCAGVTALPRWQPRLAVLFPRTWHPEAPWASEEPVLLGCHVSQRVARERTMGTCPACPSSWPPLTSCCPGNCPRSQALTWVSSALKVQHSRPHLLGEQASALTSVHLPGPGSGSSREAQLR